MSVWPLKNCIKTSLKPSDVLVMRFLELILVLQTSGHSANLKKQKMDEMSGRRLHHGSTRLTDQICIDLIDSRNETKIVQDFDNCPVEENGRKIGALDSAAQNLKT